MLEKPEHMSLKDYAEHRGVDPSLVSRWKKLGRLVMVGNKVHVAGSDALLDKLKDPRGGNRSDDAPQNGRANYMAVKTRETHWSAEQKRLKALKEAGELVEAEVVRRTAMNQARLLRDSILNIPDRLAASLAAETDAIAVHNMLLKELRTVCNQLANLAGENDGAA